MSDRQSTRVSELLALSTLKQANEVVSPPNQSAQIQGYDAISGQVQAINSSGAIVSAMPVVITGLGSGDRGITKDGFFV